MRNPLKRLTQCELDLKEVDKNITELIKRHNSTFMVLKDFMNKLGYEEYAPIIEANREAVNNHQVLEVRKIKKVKK